MAARDGYELYALTVRYGQVHAREVEAARRVAAALRRRRATSSSTSISRRSAGRRWSATATSRRIATSPPLHDIPSTYVPARNTVFLSLALAWAEVVGADAIVIGVNALDYSGYPDCRPEYLEAFERLAALATKAGVEGARLRILAPLLHLSKAEIIAAGLELGLDYGLTHSCYDPRADGRPCGRCDSCLLRAKGFLEAGVTDPVLQLVTERLYYTDPYLTEFDAPVVERPRRRRPHRRRARSHRVLPDIRRAAVRYRNDWRRPRGRRRRWRRRRDRARRRGRGGGLGARGWRLGARARFRPHRLGAALRSHAAAHRPARAVGGHRSRLRRAHRELPSWRRHGDDRSGARADHGGDRGLGRRRQRAWSGPIGRSPSSSPTRRRRPPCSLRKESVRTGTLRIIDVDGFDVSACGGTHVAAPARSASSRSRDGSVCAAARGWSSSAAAARSAPTACCATRCATAAVCCRSPPASCRRRSSGCRGTARSCGAG